MKHTYTRGSLAKAAGVGIEAIRFYERKGLLPKPARRSSGYREYREEDSTRIRFIKRAQDLGFTLKEIQGLLQLNRGPQSSCSDIQDKAEAKVKEIEVKIQDLQRMKRTLAKLVRSCGRRDRKAMAACQVMTCFESGCEC